MRCKRCGTKIDVSKVHCLGCGKELTALRADNEILYDEEGITEVEREKKERALKLQEIEKAKLASIEEVKEIDVFGDAINEMESPEIIEEIAVTKLSDETDIPIIQENEIIEIPVIKEENEEISIPKLEEEYIVNNEDFEKPSLFNQNTETVPVEDEIEVIELEENKEKVTKKQLNKTMIWVIIAIVISIITLVCFYFYVNK